MSDQRQPEIIVQCRRGRIHNKGLPKLSRGQVKFLRAKKLLAELLDARGIHRDFLARGVTGHKAGRNCPNQESGERRWRAKAQCRSSA